MEKIIILYVAFFSICLVFSLRCIIKVLRKNEETYDYHKIVEITNKQTKDNLKRLNRGNKKIDNLERKILHCKKKLGMKLYKE